MAVAVVRKASVADYSEMMRMLDRCFGHEDGNGFVERLPQLYRAPAVATRDAYLAFDGGRIVGHVGVYPLRLRRAGGGELLAGGIGAVATDPEYRGRGIMTTLLEAAVVGMKQADYDLSVLWGDRARYLRHGWDLAGAHLEWQFDARLALSSGATRLDLIAFDARHHLDAVVAAWNSDTAGTVHDPASLRSIFQCKRWQTWVLRASGGAIFMTLQQTPEELIVHKLIAPPELLAGMLLGIGQLNQTPPKRITVQCPPLPHPVARVGLQCCSAISLRTVANARILRADRLPAFRCTDRSEQVRELLGSPASATEPHVPFWIERPATV